MTSDPAPRRRVLAVGSQVHRERAQRWFDRLGLEVSWTPWEAGQEAAWIDEQVRAEAAQEVVRGLMAQQQALVRIARRSGQPIRQLKPRDDVLLFAAVWQALDEASGDVDVARMLHEVIWWQPFPNANHRTAFTYACRLLADPTGQGLPDLSSHPLRRIAERCFGRSKELMRKDTGMDDDEAKRHHLHLMRSTLAELENSIR